MEKLTELLGLINEGHQIVINKNGSGRIDCCETNEPLLFFEKIEDAIFDMKNQIQL